MRILRIIGALAVACMMFSSGTFATDTKAVESYAALEAGSTGIEIEAQESNAGTEYIEGVRVPILMYHHFSESPNNSGEVTPKKFREDMELIKGSGYNAIFLNDLLGYLEGSTDLPDNPIVITFDDGYLSNYEFAYPVAKELDMKITISMIGWSVGRDTFIDSEKQITPHFTWAQASEMFSSGLVDIQNHTYDLHSPKGDSYGYKTNVNDGVLPLETESFKEYAKRLAMDLMQLQDEIIRNTGKSPAFICYPYGYYTEVTESIIRSLGYEGSLTVQSGIRTYSTPDDLYGMPRINVSNELRGEKLIQMLNENDE